MPEVAFAPGVKGSHQTKTSQNCLFLTMFCGQTNDKFLRRHYLHLTASEAHTRTTSTHSVHTFENAVDLAIIRGAMYCLHRCPRGGQKGAYIFGGNIQHMKPLKEYDSTLGRRAQRTKSGSAHILLTAPVCCFSLEIGDGHTPFDAAFRALPCTQKVMKHGLSSSPR